MSLFLHPLGWLACDKITGFTGVITSRSQHVTGCNTYWLTPLMSKDGKVGDQRSCDEMVIEIVGKKPIFVSHHNAPAGPGAG